MVDPRTFLCSSVLFFSVFRHAAANNDTLVEEATSLSCTICRDRSPVQNPTTNLTWLLEHYDAFPVLPGITYTCQFVDTFLLPIALKEDPEDGEEDSCESVRLVLGGICGCPPIVNNYCDMCPNDEGVPLPDVPMTHVAKAVEDRYPGFLPTCGQYDLMAQQLPGDDVQCLGLQDFAWMCGCNGGESIYLGADTQRKKIALAWIPRLTGLLSLLGSGYIVHDAIAAGPVRTLYHELLFGLSFYDIIGSICWMLSTAPIYKEWFGYTGHIYGAVGNEQTCTAQGFFLQMSLTGSIFYNLMLSLYYLLTIVYTYRGSQLKKLRKWIHPIPHLIAVATAVAGIPRYKSMLLICHAVKDAPGSSFAKVDDLLIFTTIPICFVWVGATACMLFIYSKVRKTSQASNKWSFRSNGTRPSSSNPQLSVGTMSTDGADDRISQRRLRPGLAPMSRLEKSVMWQAFFYLISFWMTWPLYMMAGWFSHSLYRQHSFWIAVVIFCPLQGFFNFLVYIRPKILQTFERRRRDRRRTLAVQSRRNVQAQNPMDAVVVVEPNTDSRCQMEITRSEESRA